MRQNKFYFYECKRKTDKISERNEQEQTIRKEQECENHSIVEELIWKYHKENCKKIQKMWDFKKKVNIYKIINVNNETKIKHIWSLPADIDKFLLWNEHLITLFIERKFLFLRTFLVVRVLATRQQVLWLNFNLGRAVWKEPDST